MGAKAVVQTYNSRFSQSKEDEEIELEEIKTSHSQMKDLGLKTEKYRRRPKPGTKSFIIL